MQVSQTSAGSKEPETIFEKEENSQETTEPLSRTTSEEETPVRIFKKDKNSEVTMDKSSTDSADRLTSGPESPAGAESEKQLRLFVTLLAARVLKKCRALEKRKQAEWVDHIKSLVDQTMEGLSVYGEFGTDLKTVKKVSKSVLKDLKGKFGGQLETVILLQDPAVDEVIVRSFQAHIKDLPAQFAKKAASRQWWKEFFEGVAFAVAIVATVAVMLVIP